MPDSRSYITHYVKYFNLKAPSSFAQTIALFLLGAASGGFASVLIHQNAQTGSLTQFAIAGISSGVLVITLPALLTAVVIKTMKRGMKIRHALLMTLLVTVVYAIMLFANTLAFSITHSIGFAYGLLVLFNAAIYGYWFLMDRMIIGKGRSAIPIAAVQPTLNILFYLPLGGEILNLGLPLGATLIRLAGGMFVFLAIGYLIIYLLDRPAKKMLDVSGIRIFVTMVGQWLYDLTKDVEVVGHGAGIKRDLNVEVLALRGKHGYKGVFVNPDIHFGPFRGIGGSIAPLHIGNAITKKYKAAPFVLHAPLDLQDNPISTSQVYGVTKRIEGLVNARGGGFERAYGNLTVGRYEQCSAINITVGDAGLLVLTKAPYVTEDISREVGMHLKQFAADTLGRNMILVDAHNSRFESASPEELDGIQWGNKYVRKYEKAIKNSTPSGAMHSMGFGVSYAKPYAKLGRPKDFGEGYTSVCIFKFGRKKFCLIYIDANNMLPGFRSKIQEHIKEKFKMESELCTTDTHFINTVASIASTSLGRYTTPDEMISVLDPMIWEALANVEPVRYVYRKATLNEFPVWGDRADALISQTSRDVGNVLKYAIPLLAVLAFVIAAWVIYVI